MSDDLDDFPIINTKPPKTVTLRTLQKQTNTHVLEALQIMVEIMNNPKTPAAVRLSAASKYVENHLKILKTISEEELLDSNKRLAVLKIRRESEINAGVTSYTPPNKVSLSFEPEEQ